MGEAVYYDAYLEIQASGACLALIYDLPGCFARGIGETAALERLMQNIPQYFDWLRQHDEYTPLVSGPFSTQVKERQHTAEGDVYANAVFFSRDTEPLSNEDLDWLLALLTWAYADVRSLAKPMAADATIVTTAAIQGLAQLMMTQQWFFGILEAAPDASNAATALDQTSDAIYHWLDEQVPAQINAFYAASEAQRQRIIERDGVRWSLRKVLTRSILLARDYHIYAEQVGL